ncbi:nuclear transport factor 2 family protein [Sphingomonas bacterium]|uniref:YybH family protein n=1 Tax=Sphingomonas bacterium TaxID=1895847 RepID=UPI00261E5D7D|nr:nuclear transport factor 2 family protein [Sphingomonas bacterium]
MTSVASLLAEDALIYESGGVERGKAEYASHHLPADAAFAKAMRRAVPRTAGPADGDMVWVASEARSTGTYKGRRIARVGTEMMIQRRAGSTWRIVHIHWSAAAPKKTPDAAK